MDILCNVLTNDRYRTEINNVIAGNKLFHCFLLHLCYVF